MRTISHLLRSAQFVLLYERQRHSYILRLKDSIESNATSGNLLGAYSDFLKLCRFNVTAVPDPLHLPDPLDNDDSQPPEYVPSLLKHLPAIQRMASGTAAKLHRLLGFATALRVLLGGPGGLPMGYPSIGSDILSRTSVDVIMRQAVYFANGVEAVLSGWECVQLDGACRAVLSLLPR